MRKITTYIVVALLALAVTAQGGEKLWPKGTPTVFVGFGAGGGTDNSVRPLVVQMQKHIDETINVVNMPGASSALAAEHVMGLPNDGYSMFATGTGCYGGFLVQGTAPNAYPWKWTGFYPFQGACALIVNKDAKIDTIDIAIAKLKAGEASMGISGFGNGPHVIMEAFAKLAGVEDINYVTFDGDRAVTVGVMAGEVELGVLTFNAGIDFARNGDVKVLWLNQDSPLDLGNGVVCPAITTVYPAAKNMPMLSESWPVLIRRDAPKEVIAKLEEAFRFAVQQDAIKDYAKQNGMKIVAMSGEEADKVADYQFTAFAWILWDAGLASVDPATINLVKLENWSWDIEKKKYGY